jgi:UDP-glucuronate 4-epimerase
MTTLITGMAGFIGFHLANALAARGEEVVGVDNLNDYYDPAVKAARLQALDDKWGSQVRFHALDFANHDALDSALAGEKIDRIAHLGAQAGVRYSLTNPRAYAQSNLVGHLNLLEVARSLQVPMVYASSSSVYGGNTEMPFSVDHRVDHPISLYAATKRADELMSETYAHLYRLPLTGLRFFTVYGPWGRPDMALWMFTRDIFAGKPIPVFNNGQLRRDFTFIDDIIAGVVACLDAPPSDDGTEKPGGSKAPHAVYNIGNNRSEALMDMIAVTEEACGRKAVIDFKPMQPGDVHETHADIDAIARDHGYAPTTPITVGIPKFVEWYRGFHGI